MKDDPTTDHVFIDANTQTMHCFHCGASWPLNLPADIDDFAARCKEFWDLHRDCAAPSPTADEVSHG